MQDAGEKGQPRSQRLGGRPLPRDDMLGAADEMSCRHLVSA
jgi:hypothetical protein